MTQPNHSPQFHQVAPHLGTGQPPSTQWQPVSHFPLIIFVGVTGVGKSTTLDALAERLSFHILPNRRKLTDDLIIGQLQQRDGLPVQPVTDRAERFALTRRYRELYPGGMGYALSQLWIEPQPGESALYIFDGLRGVNEVTAACTTLPAARFVVLDAPDVVRVQRLLGRSDSFDQVAVSVSPVAKSAQRLADIGLPAGDELFSEDEIDRLLSLCAPPVGSGTVPIDELQARLKIVLEEKRNYDPSAALAALRTQAPERTLVIDTTLVSASQAADRIAAWLPKSQST